MAKAVIWKRPPSAVYFETGDADAIKSEIARIGAKSALEFGPGDSTQTLIDAGLERIVTCEHVGHWFEVAKKRFAKNKQVKCLPFLDEAPVLVPGLGKQTFDIAFVDAPQGYLALRKVHPGFEDCSRYNTVLFALERAPVVLLHDATRPLERGTLGRINALGHKITFIHGINKIGMARIERNG
jgi:hypothetical protein